MNIVTERTDELRELYRELILDHARSPRHFGTLATVTHTAEGVNPLCGDKLKIYFEVDADGNIADAAFEGSGCAISVASASLLTDTVIGLPTQEALAYFSAVVGALSGSPVVSQAAEIDLGKLKALEGVREYPSRVKCATLAWHAMNAAIQRGDQSVSTE